MKKTFIITWLVLSAIFLLISFIELIIGFSLWLKETHLNFWGPASITQIIIFVISLTSLIFSIVCLMKKQNSNK